VADFLSEEWLDELDLGALAKDRPVRVRRVVTGGPGGDVTFEAVVGGPDGEGAGDGPPAALTLTTTHDVARAVTAGELPAAVAYMQGRLKAEGDMPTLYALLSAAH
jgi:hypothetical protein